MSGQLASRGNPTVKPTIAGIFEIVIGAGVLVGMGIFGLASFVIGVFTVPWLGVVLPLIGIPGIVIGVLAIVGGVFAVQRRKWGWALAGSIAAALVSNAFGVAALILVAISRDEFAKG